MASKKSKNEEKPSKNEYGWEMKPEDFILLPEGKYGRHDYPDLLIAKRRLAADEDVARVAPRLRNSAFTREGQTYDFIGNINFKQAVQLNRKLNRATLSLVLGKEFLKLLREGIDGERVYDGKHSELDRKEMRAIYEDITKRKDPLRGEWFDTRFEEGKIIYPVYDEDWKYVQETLEDCLREDKNIDIKSWLNDSTSQGLPKPNTKKGKLDYWAPINKSVARFGANSDGAVLNCYGDPTNTNASLGVREVICAANRDAIAFEAERQRSYTLSELSSALERAGYSQAREEILKELGR